MILIEKHQITKQHSYWNDCDLLSYISKNLYNVSLYLVRQHYFQNNTLKNANNQWVFNNANLYWLLKNTLEYRTKQHCDYNGYDCNTKILKQTMRQMERVFKGYIAALKQYNITPHKFTSKPKVPNYKDTKNGRNEVTIPKEALSFKRLGYAHISRTNIDVKLLKANRDNVKEIKIVPRNGCYEILVSYEVKDSIISPICGEKIAGIDIGLNNIMALSSNDTGIKPFLVNGRPIKSINQYYNKRKSKLQELLPNNVHWSNKLSSLTRKRNNKIHTEMHKITSYVVDNLVKNDIDTLVIGNNKGIKNSSNMGKTNNQNFVGVPFYKLRKLLEYKCKLAGIWYYETEESYTSKCSFLDMEGMYCSDVYEGSRITRGLFKSSNGGKINADINGSLNIIRKVAGNDVFKFNDMSDLVEGYAVSPIKVSL